MNIERKHLAPYLDHDLKIFHGDGVWTLQWLLRYGLVADFDGDNSRMTFQYEDDIKPILRPLPDLNKLMETKDGWIVPVEELFIEFPRTTKTVEGFYADLTGYPLQMEYRIIQKLAAWHFDFQDLIGQGLAVDINTVK